MRTIDRLAVNTTGTNPSIDPRTGLLSRLEDHKRLVIFVIVAVGLFARVYRLDASGFAEDESNKIFAIRAYEQGDFTANSEHPMVMKLLCFASMHAASAWNGSAGHSLGLMISDEAAMRFPNAVFGALTVMPLLLLTTGLLGFRVGLLTGLFWSLGLDAIWFNRTAKEDTLLVFFMFLGFYFYHRAKQLPPAEVARKEKLFSLAGAAFGLMIASKYFPQYMPLNALFYTLVGYDSRNNRPLTARMWARYFAAMLLAFVVFNPALFFPQTWRYLWKYVNEELLTHHGYMVMDKLFINDFLHTPNGNPWYFYFLFIAVKLPLPVLLAFIVGFVEIFRRRGSYPQSRGYTFLRLMLLFWLLPEALAGTKFLRYALSLMPFVYMTAAIGIVQMWSVFSGLIGKLMAGRPIVRTAGALALTAAFVIAPAIMTINVLLRGSPSLFVNVFGRNRAGYFFPHDEFYDLGARESIRFIAETAPMQAMMASEIPGVVQYYLERFNRTDIRSRIISQPSFTLSTGQPDYVLLQPGRVYFENLDNFRFIEKTFPVVQSSTYDGVAASRVYATGNR